MNSFLVFLVLLLGTAAVVRSDGFPCFAGDYRVECASGSEETNEIPTGDGTGGSQGIEPPKPTVEETVNQPLTFPSDSGTSSTNPSDSGIPTNPSDSGTQTNPSDSGTSSTNPSDSGTPTNPSDSDTSTSPSDSGTPTDPSDSGTSTNPSDSGTPINPSDSGTPTNPSDSGTSTSPSDGGTSTNPSDSGTDANPSDNLPTNPDVDDTSETPNPGDSSSGSSATDTNSNPGDDTVASNSSGSGIPGDSGVGSATDHPTIYSTNQHNISIVIGSTVIKSGCNKSEDCLSSESCLLNMCLDLCTTSYCHKDEQCRTVNHKANCTCGPGLAHDDNGACSPQEETTSKPPLLSSVPPTKKGCTNDLDCTDNKTCGEGVCMDLCSNPSYCRDTEVCSTVNHRPSCSCRPGHTRDYRGLCQPQGSNTQDALPSEPVIPSSPSSPGSNSQEALPSQPVIPSSPSSPGCDPSELESEFADKDKHYYYVHTPMMWYDAQDHCRANCSTLATVLTRKDQHKLEALMKTKGIPGLGPWLGGECPSSSRCQWVSHVSLHGRHARWQRGEPDTRRGRYTCVQLRLFNGRHYWYLAECGDKRPFICHHY